MLVNENIDLDVHRLLVISWTAEQYTHMIYIAVYDPKRV
jgi:hypothetical protein